MRPGGLTAVCVIALVLAAFGMFTMLGACFNIVAQPYIADFTKSMQTAMPRPPGPAGQQFQAQIDAQDQMMEEMSAMYQKHMVLLIAQYLLHFAVMVLLTIGAIRSLSGKPSGQRWIVIAMTALIVFALFRLYPQMVIQGETQEITMRYMNRIMQMTPGAGGAPAAMSLSIMNMSTAFGMAIGAFWVLLLLGYAGTSIWYVYQPQVDQWFASSAALEIEDFTGEENPPLNPTEVDES